MIKKNILIPIILIILSLAIFILFKNSIKGKEEKGAEVKPEAEKQEVKPSRRQLTPSNPTDYGMVVSHEDDLSSQDSWDRLLEGKVKEIKSQVSAETWLKVQEKIKEEPAKTRVKIEDIDKRMKKYKRTLRREPQNAEIRKRIERLRMLKAIAKSLIQ